MYDWSVSCSLHVVQVRSCYSCLWSTPFVAAVHPKLLFTNRHAIRSIHIHGLGNYMPLLDSKAAVALDFDYLSQEVFYTDMDEKKLFKFKLPSSDSEDDVKGVSGIVGQFSCLFLL